ncbi:MAG: hypothetical protein GC162_08630 [Planctomycetes bacterium]|nr:hypothetical protein [Planctomycetota bacterium]
MKSFPAMLRYACLLLVLSTGLARADDAISFDIKTIEGLQYDVKRLVVPPGAKVVLHIENLDSMIHNLVITEPGARIEIVNAALALGADGPALGYVPKSDKVLFSVPAIEPGESAKLEFTAPKVQGVYPYVCTFPGHGFVMYGALYVGEKLTLPPEDKDPNLPPPMPAMAHHHHDAMKPIVYRTFMRDCGPAAIAVHLPGEQSYCFDAGACRLRYAWTGDFIDDLAILEAKADGFAHVLGRIWWRADDAFPLRFGNSDHPPVVHFRGYTLIESLPEFEYDVDGYRVHQLITPMPHGLAQTFRIDKLDQSVTLITDPDSGAAFASSIGGFENGELKLSAEQGRQFTIRMTNRPKVEPIGYWSMNDQQWDKCPSPEPGVRGQALRFNGKNAELDSGVTTNQLKDGLTMMAWVNVRKVAKEGAYLIGAGEADKSVGIRVDSEGFAASVADGNTTHAWHMKTTTREEWHHVALIVGDGKASFYVDGKRIETGSPVKLDMPDAHVFVGSRGGDAFYEGLMDEARLYDRALSETELEKIYKREAP